MAVRWMTEEERVQHERIYGRFGDARAQLWARVYAAEYEALRKYHPPGSVEVQLGTGAPPFPTEDGLSIVQRGAGEAANTAVRDFDEHYLGGKR